jgi:hypothetical protein
MSSRYGIEPLVAGTVLLILARGERAPSRRGIAWYLETIGMDWRDVIRRVNAMSERARASLTRALLCLPA